MTGKSSEVANARKDEVAGPGSEYLTFCLGNEVYAIDILKVQEIQGYGGVTRIAQAPDFVKGVINLRGVIVPIIDLRIRFGVGEPTYNEFTIMIILHLSHRTVGVVVDSVSDVLRLADEEVRPAPSFSAAVDTRYIRGLADVEEGMLIVLEIDGLMSDPSMALEDIDGEQG
jgi:purine-binding chemotaxis protein CheW